MTTGAVARDAFDEASDLRDMTALGLVEKAVALREARRTVDMELRMVEAYIVQRMEQMNVQALPIIEYDVRLTTRGYDYDVDALTAGLHGLVADGELNAVLVTVTKTSVDGWALRSLGIKYKGRVLAAIEDARRPKGNPSLEIKPSKNQVRSET